MAITPQQTFANFVLSKIVPAVGSHPSASNLEWNAKKFLGQVPGETLDAATYAERTQVDLASASESHPGNADLANALSTLSERFGIAPMGGGNSNVASSGGASGGSGHSGSGDHGAFEAAAEVVAGGAAPADFDINEFLSDKAEAHDEELEWDSSVVDLLKLLGKDHSVSARRKYMDELGLDAGAAGTADGNSELHTALLDKLAETGGKWPADLG